MSALKKYLLSDHTATNRRIAYINKSYTVEVYLWQKKGHGTLYPTPPKKNIRNIYESGISEPLDFKNLWGSIPPGTGTQLTTPQRRRLFFWRRKEMDVCTQAT